MPPHTQDAAAVPTLRQARTRAVEEAINHAFRDGRLAAEKRDATNFFGVLLPETQFAALAAYEWADSDGPFAGDARLIDQAVAALEGVSEQFRSTGVVGDGDMNTPYFCLGPFTRAMLSLKGHVDGAWHTRMIDRCVRLYAAAAEHINRTHDYLNPRGLEAVSALSMHRLTGDKPYLDRCTGCLDQLLTRIYPCGAQPYHTGLWVWGRKPAQGYQFLTASLMLYLAQQLDRPDAADYVRRIMDYSLIATDRRGEAFITVFEGLHKSHSHGCAGRQWPIAMALGDKRYRGLARTTYEIWAEHALGFDRSGDKASSAHGPRTGYLTALNDALALGVKAVSAKGRFVPKAGRHVLPDISTVFVHEPDRDVAMTLLTGYSAFAEADCGNVKLYALTPELTDEPTYRNCGTDPLRTDWKVPSEQIECAGRGEATVLKGRVFTKWQTHQAKDFARLHNRLLEVTMTYADGEMVLEYQTLADTSPEPVASRLLLLLIARPRTQSPRLTIGDGDDIVPPPADRDETFSFEAPVGTVRFAAPDGSAIEIVPEVCTADKIVAERPPRALSPPVVTALGSGKGPLAKAKLDKLLLRPANEGSLRLAFEGRHVLDRGRYRIRFLTGAADSRPKRRV